MNKTLLEKLKAARETLAAALAAVAAGSKELADLETKRAALAAQIEKLEKRTEQNPDDETAVAGVATARDQLKLFDKKIAKLQVEQLHDESPRIALDAAAHVAIEAIIEVGKPLVHRLTEQATVGLAPFYQPGARLELAVQRCDALLSLKAFLVNCGHGPEPEKPTRALRILDALLAGEPLPWTWQGLETPAEHAA